MGKKLVSLLLALVMVAMVLPMTAMAATDAVSPAALELQLNGEAKNVKVTVTGAKNQTCNITIPAGLVVSMGGSALANGAEIAKIPTKNGSVSVTLSVQATEVGNKVISFSNGGTCSVSVTCVHEKDEQLSKGKKATCLEPGVVAHWKCKFCDALLDAKGIALETTEIPALEHKFGDKVLTAQTATCAVEGVDDCWQCANCELYFASNADWKSSQGVETMDSFKHGKNMKNHTGSEHIPHEANEPTCTEKGNRPFWECKGCDQCFEMNDRTGKNPYSASYFDIAPDAGKHEKGKFHEEVPATCNATGKMAYYDCAVKGCTVKLDENGKVLESVKIEKDPNNHAEANLYHKDMTPATCVKEGNIEYWSCLKCNKILIKDEAQNFKEITAAETVLPVDSAHHGDNRYNSADQVATCVDEGFIPYWKCLDCGKVFAKSDEEGTKELDPADWTPAKDPTNHPEDKLKFQKAVEATCYEDGWDGYYYCSACKNYYAENDTAFENPTKKKNDFKRPQLEHEWVDGEAVDGVAYKVCTHCGKYLMNDEIIDAIPALHNLEFHKGTPATCTEAGEMDYWYCIDADCGMKFADLKATEALESTVIEALGHTTEKLVSPKNWSICTVCGQYFDNKGNEVEKPVDNDKHVLLHHTKADPSCVIGNGNIEYWECLDCGDVFGDKDGTTLISKNSLPIPYVVSNAMHHDLEHIKDAEHIEHYRCKNCGMCFDGNTDSAKVLDPSDLGATNNAGDHVLKYQPETPASCTVKGTKAHWVCLTPHNCGKYFADGEGKTPVTKAELEIAAGHKYIHFKGNGATMDAQGRKGYDYCTVCGLVRLDGTDSWITMDEAMKNWGIETLPDKGEALMYKKVAPTCTQPGMKKHWRVEDLREHIILYYEDAALTIPTTLEALTIPAAGHKLVLVPESGTNRAYQKCTVCGACFDVDVTDPGDPSAPSEPEDSFDKEPPKNVIKDDMDLSDMGLSSILGKGNEP